MQIVKQPKGPMRILSESWNRELISVRLLSAIISLCMLICAVLCMHSTVPMHQTLKTAAALVIIALGIYQLVDYYYIPVLLRDGGTLIGVVLDTMIDALLLPPLVEIIVSVFACMLGLLLMVFSVNKITFANELHFFGVSDYNWVIASGVINILAAAVSLTIPLISIMMLGTTLAGYLAVGGIALFVEVVTMKNMKIEDTQE